MQQHILARDGALIVGVDIGGTFTDVVVVDRGRADHGEGLDDPDDQSRGMVEGDRLALAGAGHRAGGGRLASAHGTTVATNALLERRGARTGARGHAAGSRDVLTLARQTRPHLYRPCVRPPAAAARADRGGGRAAGARRRAAPARPESVRAAAGGCGEPGVRRSPSACCTATPIPRHEAARGPAAAAASCRARSSSPRTRSQPSTASTSGRRPVGRRLPGAAAGALPAPAGRGDWPSAGCPSRC